MDLAFDQVDGRPIVDREAGGQVSFREEVMIGGPAFRLAVVVGTTAPLEEPEALQDDELLRPRVGQPVLEPANGPGADPRQDDPFLPGLAQQRRQTPLTPDGEHALGVAASDVDDVLPQEVISQVRRPLEQRQVRGATIVAGERLVEVDQVGVGITPRRGEEGDGGPGGPRLTQDVEVEGGIVGLHQEAAAAERDDLSLSFRHGCDHEQHGTQARWTLVNPRSLPTPKTASAYPCNRDAVALSR